MARTLFSHPEIHDPAEQSFKWTVGREAGREEGREGGREYSGY